MLLNEGMDTPLISTANKTYLWAEKYIKVSLENLSLNRFFAVLLVCQ